MITSYEYKIIVSGKEIEKYEYLDKPVLKGFIRRQRKHKNKETNPQEKIVKSSLYRTRMKIRRMVNANSQLTKFVTLTNNKEVFDLKIANRQFNLFTQRMSDHYPEFEYIAVPEFQPISQRVHYHVICNLRYVPNKIIAQIWKNGFIRINRIDRITNVGRYVCKYLSKDMNDNRLFHRKKFFYSQKLNKPFELYDFRATKYFDLYVGNITPIYEKIFTNDYSGTVLYKTFLLDSAPPKPKKYDGRSGKEIMKEKRWIDLITKFAYNDNN
jgi:hypothetical protein